MAKQDISLYGCPGNVQVDGTNQTDWIAGTTVTAPVAVCVKANDAFFDSMQTYTNSSAFQAVYVDSAPSYKMVAKDAVNYAIGSQAMSITSAGVNNSGTVAIRTIGARDLTGYSICILYKGSATTTNYQIRIGATAGLATNYLYYTLAPADTNFHFYTIPISSFSSSGSPVLTAITQVGFWHTGSGTESIYVDRMWFYLAGTTSYACYPADPANWDTLPAIGFVDVTKTTGQVIGNIVNHNLLNGFTGLIPGATVYLTTAGAITQAKDALATIKQRLGFAVSPTTIMVNVDPAVA